jgi:hypothetical protein
MRIIAPGASRPQSGTQEVNMHRGTALVATIMMLCATTAWAQKARAHIPFSFHVGDAELSAGDYEIVPGQPFHSSVMLRSRSNPANAAAALYFENEDQNQAQPEAKLVFNKYAANEYFLSEVWTLSKSSSAKLLKSRHELVTSTIVAESRPEKVVILARVEIR